MAGNICIRECGEIGHVDQIGWVGLNIPLACASNWKHWTHKKARYKRYGCFAESSSFGTSLKV